MMMRIYGIHFVVRLLLPMKNHHFDGAGIESQLLDRVAQFDRSAEESAHAFPRRKRAVLFTI